MAEQPSDIPPPEQRPKKSRLRRIIGIVGLIFIVAMVAAIVIPSYGDYEVNAKVHEGATLSSPHRTAIAIACRENALAGATYASLGVEPVGANQGKWVKKIEIAPEPTNTSARVVITYRAIRKEVLENQTVVYTATCGNGEITWTLSGTVPQRYRPKV